MVVGAETTLILCIFMQLIIKFHLKNPPAVKRARDEENDQLDASNKADMVRSSGAGFPVRLLMFYLLY
jgi:hypothetical protein